MKLHTEKHPTPKYNAGFNLIESAVVLAVVGIVIGATWVASGIMQENNRIRRVADGLLYMASKGRELIPVSEGTGVWHTITTEAIAMGIIPSDWLTSTGTIRSPFNATVTVALNNSDPVLLEFYIYGMNEARCRQLIGLMNSTAASKIIRYLWSNDKSQGAAMPVPYTHSICLPPINSLDFQVTLVRNG